jgi:hypothetical protein
MNKQNTTIRKIHLSHPQTPKPTTIKRSMWKAMGREIALAAPTGRAAQRLAEMEVIEEVL